MSQRVYWSLLSRGQCVFKGSFTYYVSHIYKVYVIYKDEDEGGMGYVMGGKCMRTKNQRRSGSIEIFGRLYTSRQV